LKEQIEIEETEEDRAPLHWPHLASTADGEEEWRRAGGRVP
jgi:hypothetical protein